MTTLDMTPGAQIPRTDVGPQTAVTQALSSAAYRDGELSAFAAVQPEVKQKDGRFALFRPNLGEAFSRAVIARTLGAARNPLVPSFGTDARLIVEHCLAAQELRDVRDRKLTTVTALSGLLFLPGTLLWLGAFQLRAWLKKGQVKQEGLIGGLVLLAVAAIAVLFALRPPFSGLAALYFRVVVLAPVVGWYLAKRIVLRSTEDLRARWLALVEGNTLAATVPKAVPRDDLDKKAADLKAQLGRLEAEQETNIQHYAGPKGILGAGRRWGSWTMSDVLQPAEGHDDFRAFHPWDLVRKITAHLKSLSISEVANSGMTNLSIQQWVMQEVGESADEIGRPAGADMDGVRMREFAIQGVADRQNLSGGPRHYLAVQFVLFDGKLIVTFTVTVTLLANTLTVEVAGHALGPVNGLFFDKPKPKETTVQKTGKFWEERTVQLPLVDNDEVVRQAVRAPFLRAPSLLAWLGGGLALPEPFGLRHAWAAPPWGSRFMSDSALKSAVPVLGAVHLATTEFLEEHDISIDRFKSRASIIKAEAQGPRPFRADAFDAG